MSAKREVRNAECGSSGRRGSGAEVAPVAAGGPFPLTPTLCPEARENRAQCWGRASRLEFETGAAGLFPHPEGECQGDGEQNAETSRFRLVLGKERAHG